MGGFPGSKRIARISAFPSSRATTDRRTPFWMKYCGGPCPPGPASSVESVPGPDKLYDPRRGGQVEDGQRDHRLPGQVHERVVAEPGQGPADPHDEEDHQRDL